VHFTSIGSWPRTAPMTVVTWQEHSVKSLSFRCALRMLFLVFCFSQLLQNTCGNMADGVKVCNSSTGKRMGEETEYAHNQRKEASAQDRRMSRGPHHNNVATLVRGQTVDVHGFHSFCTLCRIMSNKLSQGVAKLRYVVACAV